MIIAGSELTCVLSKEGALTPAGRIIVMLLTDGAALGSYVMMLEFAFPVLCAKEAEPVPEGIELLSIVMASISLTITICCSSISSLDWT